MNMIHSRTTINGYGAPVQIHRHWTPYEDGQLRTHWRNVGCRELACRLNRTPAAVRLRAFNLGLTKYETEEERDKSALDF